MPRLQARRRIITSIQARGQTDTRLTSAMRMLKPFGASRSVQSLEQALEPVERSQTLFQEGDGTRGWKDNQAILVHPITCKDEQLRPFLFRHLSETLEIEIVSRNCGPIAVVSWHYGHRRLGSDLILLLQTVETNVSSPYGLASCGSSFTIFAPPKRGLQ